MLLLIFLAFLHSLIMVKNAQFDICDSNNSTCSNNRSINHLICPVINRSLLVWPEEDLDQWQQTSGHYSDHVLITPIDEREHNRSNWGFRKYAYDVLVSDKIGPQRRIPDTRHALCKDISYDHDRLDSASIVICYHNEALSVLIRMINSIFQKTRSDLIHEILLIDDWSDEELIIQHYLTKYGHSHWPMSKVKLIRTDERLGLIRCRVHGSYISTAQVLVFLDSHCEVNEIWLEPLLHRIHERPETAVEPIIDIIDPRDFEYHAALLSRGGFEWDLSFRWLYMPWSYFDDPQNYVRPLESPAICGGLFAIRKSQFHGLGDFDMGMDVWGAENIEFSIRAWTCGARIEVVPCSRIGHVFRTYRPYSNPNSAPGTMHTNALRTAVVWLDEYKKNFFTLHPHLSNFDQGNVTARLELRRKLRCENFQWYLDNVYPELKTRSIDSDLDL